MFTKLGYCAFCILGKGGDPVVGKLGFLVFDEEL